MYIGTVRPEEARIFDSMEGYHQFHMEENQEPYGSFEVYFIDEFEASENTRLRENGTNDFCNVVPAESPGWYWCACYPGCLPDSEEPNGPFARSDQAHKDADEWSPEYDE